MYKDDNVKSLVELTLEYCTERGKTSGELDCTCTKRLHIPIQSNKDTITIICLSQYRALLRASLLRVCTFLKLYMNSTQGQ